MPLALRYLKFLCRQCKTFRGIDDDADGVEILGMVVSPKNVNRYVVKNNSKNYYRFIKFVSSKQVEIQTTNRRSKAVVLLTTEIFVVKSETSLVIPFTTIFDALL